MPDAKKKAKASKKQAVAAALLKPLGSDAPAHVALAFMRELGRERGAIRALLDDSVLDSLADAVCDAVAELEDHADRRESAMPTTSSKFAATTFTLSGWKMYFSGLEGCIGPPSPNLHQAMAREHTEGADSDDFFVTSNYGLQTTSATEWAFVVDPEHGLARLGLDAWPSELVDMLPSSRRRAASGAKPLAAFEVERARVNAELTAIHEPTILVEELTGGRLYTGPLYMKYNLVLRAASDAAPTATRDAFLRGVCKGNRYATTIHVLNSAIVKLSKLTVVRKVYRGLADGAFPESFWRADQYGVRGGVEAAFMSTTTDKSVAVGYAGGSGVSGGIVLELEQGMCDRGADIGWLSQYPHEAEILFAPLTGVELHRTRSEGSCIVAEMTVSVNLTSPTIDQVVNKMKNAFLQILTLVTEQLTHEAHRAAEEAAHLLGTSSMHPLLEGEQQGGAPPPMPPPPVAPSASSSAAGTAAGDAFATDEERLLKRARAIFDEADTDGNGELSHAELFARLRRDDAIESALGEADVRGEHLSGSMPAVGRLLVALGVDDYDDDDQGRSSSSSGVDWPTFEAAVLRIQRTVSSSGTGSSTSSAITTTQAASAQPSELLKPLRALREAALSIDGSEYVDAAFFASAVDAALGMQHEVLGEIERFKFERGVALSAPPAPSPARSPTDDASAASSASSPASAMHALLISKLDGMLSAAEQKWRYRICDPGEVPLTAAKPIIERANALATAYVPAYEGEMRARLRALQASSLQSRSIAQLIFTQNRLSDRAIENDLAEALSICGELQLEAQEADALNSLGSLEQKRANFDAAQKHYAHSLVVRKGVARKQADEKGEAAEKDTMPPIAQSLVSLGNLALKRGDAAAQTGDAHGAHAWYVEAKPHFEEAVDAYYRGFHAAHPKVAWALEGLGNLHERLGEPAAALAALERAVAARKSGDGKWDKEIAAAEAKCAALRKHLDE